MSELTLAAERGDIGTDIGAMSELTLAAVSGAGAEVSAEVSAEDARTVLGVGTVNLPDMTT